MCAALVACVALLGACGDGTPPFCTSLRTNSDLDGLAAALESGDLEQARVEALRLSDLADDAPAEIRSDLRTLADAVTEIVDLLADEASGGSEPGEDERRRDQLNDEFGELDQRSDRVSTWALRECGLRLT